MTMSQPLWTHDGQNPFTCPLRQHISRQHSLSLKQAHLIKIPHMRHRKES